MTSKIQARQNEDNTYMKNLGSYQARQANLTDHRIQQEQINNNKQFNNFSETEDIPKEICINKSSIIESHFKNKVQNSQTQLNQPSIYQRESNHLKNGIFEHQQNKLFSLPNKFQIKKRFDAVSFFNKMNENSLYNVNYDINEIHLVGNQCTSKHTPLPQNSIIKFPIYTRNSIRQNQSHDKISNHRDLLLSMKQNYKNRRDSLGKSEQRQTHFQDKGEYKVEINKRQNNIDRNHRIQINKDNILDEQKQTTSNQKTQLSIVDSSRSTIEVNKHRKLVSQAEKKIRALKDQKNIREPQSRIKNESLKYSATKNTNKPRGKNQEHEDYDKVEDTNKTGNTQKQQEKTKDRAKQNSHNNKLLIAHHTGQEKEKYEQSSKIQKQIKAKYNGISITSKQAVKEEPYKYIVIRGNNSGLVKRCLDNREGNWVEISSNNTLFNFKWIPFSKNIRFDYLTTHGQKKMVNHFEGQSQITQKDNLLINMLKYCESQKQNAFEVIPVSFIITLGQNQSNLELEKFSTYFNILESNKQNPLISQINTTINHNSHFTNFKYEYSTKLNLTETMFEGQNFWLIKPPDFNRGRGVQVFNTIDQLKKLLTDYQQGVEIIDQGSCRILQNQGKINNNNNNTTTNKQSSVPLEQKLHNFTNLEKVPNLVKTNEFIIQKYIEKPLLIRKRKFDIRLWVLIAQDHKCYLFREGYIRTSSQEFELTPQSIDKPYIHLTNNAIQKHNENYGTFEEGNQLSFNCAQELLQKDGIQCDIYGIVNKQIEQVIVTSLKAVEGKINEENRKFCMEIFGYDFILDENQRAWLIEVNTNPCLEESSSLLKQLIPRLIDDSLKLTIDIIFPPKIHKKAEEILIDSESDESDKSILIGSEPGIGQQGPIQIHETGKVPSVSLVKEVKDRKQSDNSNQLTNSKQEIPSTTCRQACKSQYSVDGYTDYENMWYQIYKLKI